MTYSKRIENVYLQSVASIVGPKESKGPYGHYFDLRINDYYHNQKTFEEGEVKMIEDVIALSLKKAKIKQKRIDLVIGGDLSNQIAISSLAMKGIACSAIGVYGACATCTLSLGLASLYIEQGLINYALTFTSSSYPVAERQFRYPNNYGIQKKDSTTSTVTGAAAFIVGNRVSKIKISEMTIGRVYDPNKTDLNDLGSPMAYAAYKTINDHFENLDTSHDDYDLILTGDLSKVGSSVLLDCFKADGIILKNHQDAGRSIYYREKEKVYAGGSGAACISVMIAGYIIKEMLKGKYKKVLLVATGALFSSTLSYQKHSIPVVAHAITLEVNDEF